MACFPAIVKNDVLSRTFANTCSPKALRDSAAVPESQPTPATLAGDGDDGHDDDDDNETGGDDDDLWLVKAIRLSNIKLKPCCCSGFENPGGC